MKELIKFFIDVGALRKVTRRGWLLIGAKEPASVSDHSFRMAVMAWIFSKSKKNIDFAKAMKIALIHDLCELYAGDNTPYDRDNLLPQDKKKWPPLFDRWPRFTKAQKEKFVAQKRKREEKGLDKVLKNLPDNLSKELKELWLEYVNIKSPEARFVKQINRVETLLQALEYGKEGKKKPFNSWWIGTKEIVDDPVLLEFASTMAKVFPVSRVKKTKKK